MSFSGSRLPVGAMGFGVQAKWSIVAKVYQSLAARLPLVSTAAVNVSVPPLGSGSPSRS